MENILQKEYNTFMFWFAERHPDLFDKYLGNIEIPHFGFRGGVCVNMNNQISYSEFQMLVEIAREYYRHDRRFSTKDSADVITNSKLLE